MVTKLVLDDDISIDDPFPTTLTFPAGSSKATAVTVSFVSFREVRDACGESRLDGGIHFEASVPASYELCNGFGPFLRLYLLSNSTVGRA